MKISKILIVLTILAVSITSCVQDDFGESGINSAPGESERVISLVSGRTDGILSLAIDVLQGTRDGAWIDLNGDGVRAKDGTEDITVFGAYQDYEVASGLKAISVYGNITYFAAASNELITLDVSRNSSLETLNVPFNKLTSLNLSKNTALVRLDCSGNVLASLDVSQNRSLVSLWTANNRLTELNVSTNASLAFLDCSDNKLNTLEVSGNSELERLLCYNNQISTLDLSQNGNLVKLWIFNNSFTSEEMDQLIASLPKVAQGSLWIATDQIISRQEE